MAIDLLPLDLAPAERDEILATVEASARRGARLVGQVLAFARGVDGARVDVDLRDLLGPLVSELRAGTPAAIAIDATFAPDLHRVVGDPQQLVQVVRNLCDNARAAMPAGGRLVVSATNVEAGTSVDGWRETLPFPAVAITVHDTGVGMTPDILARIFDPFFTTRDVGAAAGLGLSSALAIVQSHGGRLDARSTPNEGSTFRVLLPAHVEAVVPAAQGRTLPRAGGRGELVLVVDDEASVRLMTRRALESGGYRVLLAADGAEALALYREYATEVALVLTDLRMPVMDGMQTAAALRLVDPTVRVLLSSGATDDAVARPDRDDLARLAKPYTADTLLRAVRAAIGSPSD